MNKHITHWGLIVVLAMAGLALAQGTYRSGFRTGCTTGPLYTTCGHRLDATVMQPLAALKWTADGVQPLLAESWTMEDGGRAFVFNLRRGVTWHDGAPFTADDVVFTFNTYADPKVASTWVTKVSDILGYEAFQSGEADRLAGVTKIDDHTVRIELKNPSPLWVDLQQIFIVILPQHILGSVAPDGMRGHPFWENRVGTGPFKWTRYVPDQFIEVVRNDDYFLGAPRLERIVYQIYADIPTILNALENGEIDSFPFEGGGIPPTEVERMLRLDHLVVLPTLDAGLPTYLQLNHTNEWLSDVRFRQAIMHAIDRAGIIETILMGRPRLANTQFPAEWTHPDTLNTYPYDPAKARELLTDAGLAPGQRVSFDFIYYYRDNVSADVIVTIQQYLSEVGIDIVPRLLDPPAIQAVYADNLFEMGYFANGQGLDPSLGSTLFQCGAMLALGYCNPRLDELAVLATSTADREARAPFYQEISQILNDEVPRAWFMHEVRPLAFNKRVVGLSERWLEQPLVLFNIPVYTQIETWYVNE